MQDWLLKKLGISQEIVEQAKSSVARIEAAALTYPHLVIDRQLLVLVPKAKYLAWQQRWADQSKADVQYRDKAEKKWANSRAYLVPYMEKESDLEKFILKHSHYLLYSFVGGHAPKERWPWVPSEAEFSEWFDVRIVGWGPWDMEPATLEKEPDDCVAMGLVD